MTIIVPCYNEEDRLPVGLFRRFLSEDKSVRFLFVNDGSRDATLAILQSFQLEAGERVIVLDLTRNCGKAEAVRAGFCFALSQWKQEFVGYWDADLATPLPSILTFVEVLRNHQVAMVFGSRVKLCGRHIDRRPVRHYLGRVFATVVSTMLGLAIYDTQCGAKLFRVDQTLREVFALPFASKWVFDVEILARFLETNTPRELEEKLYEYPLEVWRDVAGSKVKSGDFFKAILEVAALYRRLRLYKKKTS